MHKTRTNKHRFRRPVWGDWSDWIWSAEHCTYYRARRDIRSRCLALDSDVLAGNYEYDYHPGGGATADEIPRQTQATPEHPSIEDIAHGINQLSATPYAYTSQSARGRSSEIQDGPREQPEYSYAQSSHHLEEEADGVNEKGKEKVLSHGSEETEVDGARHLATTLMVDEAYELDQDQSAANTLTGFDDPDLQAAIHVSRGWDQQRLGESSLSGQVYTYAPYDLEGDEGPPTPKPLDIRGSGGEIEALDPRYVIEPFSRFQPGEVFKIHWAEPSGDAGGTPTISDKRMLQDQYGGAIFVGFRRPILTYGGKACKKRGVKPHKHGIIYVQGHRPKPLENEPKLGFSPARMKIDAEGETLAKESRVNYSKLVTVEHNVKVFFIGRIISEDWDIVLDAVDKCWENKIRHRRRKTRK
ncbi:hypothetical protein ACRALDRAFT_1069289 [Sodiomyces alcalophilus JCM 7366]|uniref:uncharacterized protein n=1 Tax=Sodiomyces alcalophilus JCM 7366 TaxID=591952 RepID=UPI0039B4E539